MVKGVRTVSRKSAGAGVRAISGGDARNKIILSNRANTFDARDNLAKLARKSDARQKLDKIRNLKKGNLEVKKIGAGGITLTKKLNGKLVLTTMKKGKKEVKQIGRLTQTITNGKITLSSKLVGRKKLGEVPVLRKPVKQRRDVVEGVGPGVTTTNSSAARLDEELMTAVVDPALLRRTVQQGRRSRDEQPRDRSPTWGRDRSPLRTRERSPILRQRDRVLSLGNGRYSDVSSTSSSRQALGQIQRSRSTGGLGHRDVGLRIREVSPLRRTGVGRLERSPLRRSGSSLSRGGRIFDYDDPRPALERENEIFKRRIKDEKDRLIPARFDSSAMNGVSPLQGCKVVITNLQTTVTQEDILELFGDIGALRRAKLVNPGHAEVTFVERKEAERAVEVYHNRQLDGKPMKCQLVGTESAPARSGATIKLPPSLARRSSGDARAPAPDLESIHRALFFNKKNAGKKPLFTITMPKKSKEEERVNVW